jgi:hypothetical protein
MLDDILGVLDDWMNECLLNSWLLFVKNQINIKIIKKNKEKNQRKKNKLKTFFNIY